MKRPRASARGLSFLPIDAVLHAADAAVRGLVAALLRDSTQVLILVVGDAIVSDLAHLVLDLADRPRQLAQIFALIRLLAAADELLALLGELVEAQLEL